MQVSPQLVPGVICGRWAAEGRRDDGRGGSEQGEENVVRVEVALTGGADCGGERLLGGGAPCQERLPPQTLRVTTAGRMACSARQLVGKASPSSGPRILGL